MRKLKCLGCGKDAVLSEDEAAVFEQNNLLKGSGLNKCPFCIEAPIYGSVRRSRPRSCDPGTMHGGLSGFYSNTGSERVTVKPRK